jgi:hypothetical protein
MYDRPVEANRVDSLLLGSLIEADSGNTLDLNGAWATSAAVFTR